MFHVRHQDRGRLGSVGDMSYDVAAVRAQFPALRAGTAHFDGPGGTQVPDVVGRAVADTLTSAISNRGTVTASERRADRVVTDCRAALADLLGADPRGIVLGRSATAITYDLARAPAKHWGPGDEVVVLPSGMTSRIESIDTFDGPLDEARPPQAVVVTLADDVDVTRGDMICRPHNQPTTTQDVDAMIAWMDSTASLQPRRIYRLKHTTRTVRAMVTDVL